MSNRPKTIFCDIDGTLVEHAKPTLAAKPSHSMTLLSGTKEAIETWDRHGYNVILVTGRKESLRGQTERQLSSIGIVYDRLLMGIGGGDRIIINDRKITGRATAWSIVLDRDEGLEGIAFENLMQVAMNYFHAWESKDLDALERLLCPSAKLVDWSLSCSGRDKVLQANRGIFESVDKLSITVHEMSHSKNTVFCKITVKADDESIPVVDIIEFDENSKIKSITAYRGN